MLTIIQTIIFIFLIIISVINEKIRKSEEIQTYIGFIIALISLIIYAIDIYTFENKANSFTLKNVNDTHIHT